ncbi:MULTISPECIES: restriction endonuclease subunit S [Pseudomonas]|uniref:restriction endonuclease subunit S n=1 Tax=Pseudomonas TaxID=286 RepID=UPI000A7A8391|nr:MULTISPECIES: restriction endonuclease subunit S [Pseudomonas]MDU4255037.1 restriction endonuclease subunit S [Pseudomonas sp.]
MSHYKPYPVYKDSGVEWLGRVPEHWYVVRMRYAATLNPPVRRDLLDDPDQEVSFLPMEAIGEDGSLNLEQNRPVADVRNGYSYFEDGDVAFAKVTPCFENGKGALMRGLRCAAGFGTTELTVLRPNLAVADARYINYIVQGSSFRAFGAGAMTGAGGLKRVPDEFTRNFPVLLPELGEQRVIASTLDRETARIDALIEKKTRFIELLREKRQALITHAVTKGLDPNVKMKDSGMEWLGEVPEHWGVKQLKHVVDPNSSITYGIVQAGPEYEGGVPYIRTSDMSGDELPVSGYPLTSPEIDESYARSRVRPGDIVMSIRASVGKCLPVPDGLSLANLTQGTAKVSPGQSVTREFLLAFLNSSAAQAYFDLMAKGATFKEITLDALRRTPVLLPPREEQAEIDRFVALHDGHLGQLVRLSERSIELLKERRSALITAAVTGQIDLREAV